LIVNQARERGVDDDELIDSGAPPVSAVPASVTPDRPIERLDPVAAEALEHCGFPSRRRGSLPASGTQAANETLGEHAEQARGKQVRLYAHIGEARYRAHRVVRMQSRQHKVSGETRLDRDLRGLEVPNLADHDDVGILAQYRAQSAGEGQLDPRIDLRLP